MMTTYSWTSEQSSRAALKRLQLQSKTQPYVLDEILNNETELLILEHTTDNAGTRS